MEHTVDEIKEMIGSDSEMARFNRNAGQRQVRSIRHSKEETEYE